MKPRVLAKLVALTLLFGAGQGLALDISVEYRNGSKVVDDANHTVDWPAFCLTWRNVDPNDRLKRGYRFIVGYKPGSSYFNELKAMGKIVFAHNFTQTAVNSGNLVYTSENTWKFSVGDLANPQPAFPSSVDYVGSMGLLYEGDEIREGMVLCIDTTILRREEQIYVGYGVGATGLDAWRDMVANGKYAYITTIPAASIDPAPLAGTTFNFPGVR